MHVGVCSHPHPLEQCRLSFPQPTVQALCCVLCRGGVEGHNPVSSPLIVCPMGEQKQLYSLMCKYCCYKSLCTHIRRRGGFCSPLWKVLVTVCLFIIFATITLDSKHTFQNLITVPYQKLQMSGLLVRLC